MSGGSDEHGWSDACFAFADTRLTSAPTAAWSDVPSDERQKRTVRGTRAESYLDSPPMQGRLSADVRVRLERVRSVVRSAPLEGCYESDTYAWRDAQEIVQLLLAWAERVERGSYRTGRDDITRSHLERLLTMPGVEEQLGPANADAAALIPVLFESLPVEYPMADGDSPESARLRAILFDRIAVPAGALMLLGFSVSATAEDGLASSGTFGVVVSLCILVWPLRFWARRLRRR